MELQKCKGCRDLRPEEMEKFRYIESVFRESCLKWGYREIRTPTLEYLYLFTSAGTLTPGMLRRVYSFLDWDGWSGERVVLRPDGTIPAARFYIDQMKEEGLARLCYVINTFVFEETGKESRERWQCGTEIIGEGSVIASAELISLAVEVLERLEVGKVTIKLSHAGLIRALLESLELKKEEREKIFNGLLDGDREVLKRLKPDKPELVKAMSLLLDIKGSSSGYLKNIAALVEKSVKELKKPLGDFIAIVEKLESLGYNCQVDLTIGKGFEYYTGIIFRLMVGKDNVGGGGRYDDLIPLLGDGKTPAAGFALYFDKLIALLKADAIEKEIGKKIAIEVGEQSGKETFELARKIRGAGYIVEFSYGRGKAKNARWILEVKNAGGDFVITDSKRIRKITLKSAEEVMEVIGGGDVA